MTSDRPTTTTTLYLRADDQQFDRGGFGEPSEESPCARAGVAFLQSERRYERMANTLPVMLYDSILCPDGTSRFLYVAPDPCRELLELEPDALLADMSLVWAVIHPDDIGRFQQEDLAANREGKMFISELRIITPSGLLKWLLVNSRPNPAEPGEPVVWSGYLQDITARKQAEEARIELERKLERAKKSASLMRMAGAIAHNFNNQLQVVIGNLELGMHKLPPDSGALASLIGAMKAAGRTADMTRLMSAYVGQAPVTRDPLNLVDLFRENLPRLRAGLSKDVSLTVDFPVLGPTIDANAHQIQQVLNNLLTNAWESLDDGRGSIRLVVKTVSPVDVPTWHRFPMNWQPQDRFYACLEVSDTGCGIAERDLEQLFDPFFTTKFTGRGLGLSVALGIVRAHQGVVTVKSEVGRNSTFQVFIPASNEVVPSLAERPGQTPEIEGRNTVLLVEDEQIVREIANCMLTDLGCLVLEARDGIEALELFGQHRDSIDLVLSDLTMPRMTGWELLAALRQRKPELAVILASGYDQAQVMAGEHPEQPQAFLSKPYSRAELAATVDHVLKNGVSG